MEYIKGAGIGVFGLTLWRKLENPGKTTILGWGIKLLGVHDITFSSSKTKFYSCRNHISYQFLYIVYVGFCFCF